MAEDEEIGVPAWVGRKVRHTDHDDHEYAFLGPATVLAVDDTAYAPSAWIKYSGTDEATKRDYPSYRSVDLSDLKDIETGQYGPRWGTLGYEVGSRNPGATPVPATD